MRSYQSSYQSSYQYCARLIFACLIFASLIFLTACTSGAKKAQEAEQMLSASGQKQPESPPPSGKDLLNMAEKDVVRLLGTPDFDRDEGPVRHIQYRNRLCVVNIFLAAKKAGHNIKKERHVTHADLRFYATKEATPTTPTGCWEELKQKRKKTKTGNPT